MHQELVPASGGPAADNAMVALANVADAYARSTVFSDYLATRAPNTRRAQLADLAFFSTYLAATGLPQPPTAKQLQASPAAWAGVSHGIVKGFRDWQLGQGAALSSTNRRLATVRKYAALAYQAGVLSESAHALIRTVQAYGSKAGRHLDQQRAERGVPTRTGHKKAAHISITAEQAAALKSQPATPQGRRDALLMCLLVDHGLRVGELADLRAGDFDLAKGEMVFYRAKVDKVQRHKLSADTLRALRAWIDSGDCPEFEGAPVLRASRKGGALEEAGMVERSISVRVRTLGERAGIQGLSAHDCRHYWTTHWAGKVDLFRLQEAGGWNSLAMPRRYTEWSQIANEGMA